jgi:hypothetical protein
MNNSIIDQNCTNITFGNDTTFFNISTLINSTLNTTTDDILLQLNKRSNKRLYTSIILILTTIAVLYYFNIFSFRKLIQSKKLFFYIYIYRIILLL